MSAPPKPRTWWRAVRRALRERKDSLSGRSWTRVQNLMNALRNRPPRFAWRDGLYLCTDRDMAMWFPHPRRALVRNRGTVPRLRALAESYCMEDIPLRPGDVVLDVGANIGEVGLYCRRLASGVRYVAFEPAPREFACLQRNVPDAEAHNVALWYEPATLPLYLKSALADSSLIPISDPEGIIEIPCVPLDDLAPDGPIRLLKMDAEGAEPEVLRGAEATLRRCDYIVIDAGPERGKDHALTLPEVVNMLVPRGFDLERLGEGRMVVRFRNRALGGGGTAA